MNRTDSFILKNNLMKTTFLMFFMLIGITLTHSVQAQTLEEFQKKAAEQNPALKSSYMNYLAALEQTAQAGTLPDPELSFGYFISPIETRLGPQQARVSLSQMFPWFGTLSHASSASVLNAKAAFGQFQEKRNLLFYAISDVYAKIYETDENINLTREHIILLKTIEQLSISKYENGKVSQADVLQTQIELSDLENKLHSLQDKRQNQEHTFQEMVGDSTISVSTDQQISVSEKTYTEAEVLKQAQDQNPTLKAQFFKIQSAEERMEVAKRRGLPTIGFSVDYVFTGERNDVANLQDNGKDAFMAGFKINLPVNRTKYSAATQEAEIIRNSAQEQRISAENRLRKEILNTLTRIKTERRNREHFGNGQIQRTQQTIDLLMEAYANGNVSMEEILRLQRKLLGYQWQEIQSQTAIFKLNHYLDYLIGAHNKSPEYFSQND